jgi:hypothetical protein
VVLYSEFIVNSMGEETWGKKEGEKGDGGGEIWGGS